MDGVNAEEFRVVNADKFEAMESELAALREELAESNECYRSLAMRSDVAATVLNEQEAELKDVQQRLTAAEQRNSDVEKRAADLIECLWGIELPGAGNPRLRKLRRALEALKTTESGASE